MLKSYKDKSKNKPYIIVEISDKIMVNIMKKVRQILNIDSLHKNNIMGENVTVAVLDTGIYNHPDFGERIIKYKDFVNGKTAIYDDEGHGTHVTGILAGDGKMSNGFFKGIAPKSDIVSLKVLDKRGIGKEDNVISGIWWIIDNGKKYNIKVVNISFGTFNKEGNNKKLIEAVELLWDMGYVIIAAAGNNGPEYGTVSIPGSSKKIITVEALDDNIKMIVNGRITKNYSGRGPTKECVQKPDILAPANGIYSCSNGIKSGYSYVPKSGTSMATPIVSGVICMILGINKEMSNIQCKKLIRNTAIDLKMEGNRQGWGKINPEKMVNFCKK